MNTLDTAEHAIEKGLSVLLIERDSKIPKYPFRNQPPLSMDRLRRLYKRGMNIAIRLPGLAALDADDQAGLDRIRSLPESPITQITPHLGEHRVFQLPEGLKLNCRQRMFGVGYDLKTGENSFLMLSPSRVEGKAYRLLGELVPAEELPEFNPEWLPKPKEIARPPPVSSLVSRNIEGVRKYISHIFAVNQSGGHNDCYRAACKLADAGLSEEEVYRELVIWNMTNAIERSGAPCPFDDRALRHKAHDAVHRRRK
jgi:hypothetical protein